MKLAIVILLAIGPLAVYSVNRKLLNECAKQEGVTRELLIKDVTNMKIKCMTYCQYEKTKIIVNGKINIPDIPNAKPCLNVKDDNKCELGFKLKLCLRLYLTKKEWAQMP